LTSKWENEYDPGRGVIGIYDVKDSFRFVDTISTQGIGPLEIELLAYGKL